MNSKKISAAILILTIASIIYGTLNIHSQNQIASASSADRIAKKTPFSCINPTRADESEYCTEIENQILAATIRIELHTWATFGGYTKDITTKSHATILDGKYLLTHNHYKYSLTEQVEAYGQVEGYTGISLRTTSGALLIENAPLNSFSIAYENPQTLVLAFLAGDGIGIFQNAGLPSARFADEDSISLEEGTELAQIDWDGETAHIDWVRVDSLSLNIEIPQLQVNNYPKKGCSGGGVFWNGIHIGNNWGKNLEMDPETEEVIRRYSTIALNTSALMESTP
jgi:hypothetical protein